MPENPLCPYFESCGGCTSQHVPYSVQLGNKKDFVINELKKSSISVKSESIKVISGNPYHYRNRMDFAFFPIGIGLRKKGQFDQIIPINRCEISNEKLNTLLKELWEFISSNRNNLDIFDIKKKSGTFRYALIRSPEFSTSSTISFVFNTDSNKQLDQLELIKAFAEKSSAENMVVSRVSSKTDMSYSDDFFTVKGDAHVYENLAGKKLFFHSQGFFQNNSAMAEKMILYIKEKMSNYNTKDASLIDLYGGVGTFGISLAENFKDCLIIECVKESIECADMNIKENNITNTKTLCLDASYIKNAKVRESLKSSRLFLITDPPRSGMHPKTLKFILELKPEVIFYVSCNPKELAKDLKKLTESYNLISLSIFDLFPQTNHMEVIAELNLKNIE